MAQSLGGLLHFGHFLVQPDIGKLNKHFQKRKKSKSVLVYIIIIYFIIRVIDKYQSYYRESLRT